MRRSLAQLAAGVLLATALAVAAPPFSAHGHASRASLADSVSALTPTGSPCVFCSTTGGGVVSFDLSTLPNTTFVVPDARPSESMSYLVASPCSNAVPVDGVCQNAIVGPGLQRFGSRCLNLGMLSWVPGLQTNVSVDASGGGLNISMLGEVDSEACGTTARRRLNFIMVCDKTVPASHGPDNQVVESPGCTYTVTWRHPSACPATAPQATCAHPSPPSPPPPVPCATCLPRWEPTWDMRNSTILMACNDSGFHDVNEAIQYGVVVYDWSNAKQLWANTKPMNDEELLTVQALKVLAADPGVPGQQPRVWVYRNTIKALNWYGSVRRKLDDPAYAGWFVRFKDYKGPSSNHSYHVPACTYEKCSGFYHDQEQTPEHPRGDGSCVDECDCGAAPCGEYIFDFRNDTFADWFIHEYMITNETLLHKPIAIGLGWMDDSMKPTGPTEEDKNFIADTGSTPQDMADHVAAYHATMAKFEAEAVAQGGFTWQLIKGRGPQIINTTAELCTSTLRTWCVPKPTAWQVGHNFGVSAKTALAQAEQLTSEFLLTRGPYAWIGFGWQGCTSEARPRPKLWDVDYGMPDAPCSETGTNTGVFSRSYAKATVSWDCNHNKGTITMK